MPQQRPGKSNQSYQTPPEFLRALKHRLRIREFRCDLAASDTNAVAGLYYTEECSALLETAGWNFGNEWAFCNPPYADIRPWVAKATSESKKGAQIAMLVPASVGSNWWRDHVHCVAHVLFCSPRLTFIGAKDPYPKDLAVLLYTPYIRGGYECWPWTIDYVQSGVLGDPIIG